MKCKRCKQVLETIHAYHTINGGVRFTIDHNTDVLLKTCPNYGCSERGIVKVVMTEVPV